MNNKKIIVGAALLIGAIMLLSSNKGGVTDNTTTQQVPIDSNSGIEEKIVNENGIREVVVEGKNFSFEPSVLVFSPGEVVRLTFKSVGGLHNFVLEGQNVATKQINTGDQDTIEFVVPEKPGTYAFYCSVGNHRALGMEGELVVEGGDN